LTKSLNMKTLASLLIVVLVTAGFAPAPKAATGTLTFKYSVINIVEGYDHISKLVIFEDGEKIGESSEHVESKPNSVTVNLSKGSHNIRAVLTSLYEGNWEEHTIANEYSIDCFFEDKVAIKKKKTITLVFDIDKGTIIK
jgi:hypothetical protein